MARSRILHIIPRLVSHGAERMAVQLMSSLDRTLFEPALVSMYDRGGWDLEQMLDDEKIQTWYLGKHSGFDPRMYLRLDKVIREFQPNVIHTHLCVLRYALPTMLFRHSGVSLHTVHSLAEKEAEPAVRWIHNAAFRRGVLPVGVSTEVGLSVQRLYGLEECEVITNGVPLEQHESSAENRLRWRQDHGFAANDVLFICVARFDEVKNHELALNAFAGVSSYVPGANFLLAGEGELEPQLRKQAASLGIESKVHFLGHRTDVPLLLNASDIFVLTSRREGNPLSLLEAMAAGLPAICTRVGGLPELVKTNQNGILVPSEDVATLTVAMRMLAQSPDIRKQMGAVSAERARNEFSASTMVAAYSSIYTKLTNAKADRPIKNAQVSVGTL